METGIHRLSLGICNCYLIRQKGTMLVDAGPPSGTDKLRSSLAALSVDPSEVSLLVLTHGHWDHIGATATWKTLTDCKVAINRREKEWVQFAMKPLPPGIGAWGAVLGGMMRLAVPMVRFAGSDVDIILGDDPLTLEPFGINGRVLHTPGHTSGSMSVLLDTGDAFVGDLAMNGLPLRIGPGMPSLGEDAVTIRESWQLILSHGARTIYPSHGKPFPASVLAKALQRDR